MNTYKTEGIIIKRHEIGEADRILVVFTKDQGKIALKAKGVRKILAKLKGHLELFNHSRFVIAKSQKGTIDTIIGAETVKAYRELKSSLKKTSRVYQILEFFDKIFAENDPHEKLFRLLVYILDEVEKEGSKDRRLMLISYLNLKTLRSLGFRPHFRECIRCQMPLNRGGNFFDLGGAGTIGRNHVRNGEESSSDLIPVSDEAVIGLRLLIESGKKKLKRIKAKKEVIQEIYDLVERYVSVVIDTELKSKKFAKKVD